MMTDIKVISLNVNGLNNPIKRKTILLKLKREGGYIIFLQETHLSKEEHQKLERIAEAVVFSSSHSSARRGVAILVRNNIPFQVGKLLADKDGRYVLVEGKIEEK